MKKIIFAGLAFSVLATAAAASALTDRQDVMKSFNTASRTLGGMARGTAPFDAAVAKEQLQVIIDGSAKLPDLIPAGSDKDEGEVKTQALPTVWSDTAGFLAAATKINTDAKAALAATDQASFATAWTEVQGDCGGCHRTYRATPPGRGPGGGGAGGPPAGAPSGQ